ncbi:MAG: hypothetical protein ACUVWJ_05625 [Spirochaetota bacterium]
MKRAIRNIAIYTTFVLMVTSITGKFQLFAADIGFMGINIGMTRVEVIETAEHIPLIEVPRNRDVELFPVEERKILTLSIKPEIPFMYLQFFNEKLYAITIIFDERYVDYFSLCDALKQKYGSYTSLSPSWRQWNPEGAIIKVEKPAVVKYIALKEFLRETDFKAGSSAEKESRKALLLDAL